MTARNWCFTVNNPELPFTLSNEDKIKICVYQLEKGQNGTPHIQGYIELKSPTRISGLKRMSFLSRAHLEVRKGSRLQALQYVTKQDTRLEEPHSFGLTTTITEFIESLKPKKKQSEELQEIKAKLDQGKTSVEIADEHFDLWVRHYRAFERYSCLKTAPRNHQVDVHLVIGPTGTGKSRWAMDQHPNAYWKQRSQWWCGYSGQDTVILDEYYGWLPYDLLLRLCDRYPLLVESKGGQIQMECSRIIITSNHLPDKWYKPDIYIAALLRRISHFHFLPELGTHLELSSYEQLLAKF